MPASLGRPSTFLLLTIVGASSVLAGACSQRSAPRTRPETRTAPSMIEPSRCDAASTIEVAGTSNIFGAGLADPPAPAGGGAGTAPPCVSFLSTVTSISIRAAGTVQFARSDDDDGPFHRLRRWAAWSIRAAARTGWWDNVVVRCLARGENPVVPPRPDVDPGRGLDLRDLLHRWQRVPRRRLPHRCRARRTTPSEPRLHQESGLRVAFTGTCPDLLHRRWPNRLWSTASVPCANGSHAVVLRLRGCLVFPGSGGLLRG